MGTELTRRRLLGLAGAGAETSNDIMDLLERINRTGTTVVMATHDHHIVDSMRQRVVELSLGRLVRDEQRGVYGMDR